MEDQTKMRPGQQWTDEQKVKLREARAKQKSAVIGRYGITQEIFDASMAAGLRWCAGSCKKFLEPSQFNVNSRQCKKCTADSVQRFRDGLTAEERKLAAEYFKSLRDGKPIKWPISHKPNPHPVSRANRRSHLKKKYGVTHEWYEETLAAQGGACAICGRKDPGSTVMPFFAIDHNHTTKQVRGILCVMCNHALERVESVGDWAQRAVDYLRKYNC